MCRMVLMTPNAKMQFDTSLIEWYKSRAADKLAAGLERWWPKLGRGEKSRILIRDHRRQWGSCAADGTLRFNWRLVMTKPALIEYVVVHELAHLTHRNHSADFWGSGVQDNAGCAPETEAAGRGGPTAPHFVRPVLPSSPNVSEVPRPMATQRPLHRI